MSDDDAPYASAIFISLPGATKIIEDLRTAFLSRLDRRIVVTSNRAGDMDSPPEFDGEIVPGTLAAAWARHRERIASDHDAYRGSPAAAVLDRDELRRFVVAISRRVVEHGVARGLFTPMPSAEVAALRRGESVAVAKHRRVANTVLVWLTVLVLLLAILVLLLIAPRDLW